MNEGKKPNSSFMAVLRQLVYFSPFFFPAYLLRFQVYGIPFTLLEVYTYILFVLWILSLLSPKVFYLMQFSLSF